MNDSQLIERLAGTDLYPNDLPLPETMRPDIGLLEITRRMDMDTMERVEVVKPPKPKRNGPLIAAAAFALVIVIGLVGALLTSPNEGTEPANPTSTTAPPVGSDSVHFGQFQAWYAFNYIPRNVIDSIGTTSELFRWVVYNHLAQHLGFLTIPVYPGLSQPSQMAGVMIGHR